MTQQNSNTFSLYLYLILDIRLNYYTTLTDPTTTVLIEYLHSGIFSDIIVPNYE